jgi:hypothetical protein
VAGWGVRTRPLAHYGLGLHRGDSGDFMLILAHDEPRMWLVGWISAAAGFQIGTLRSDGAYRNESLWWLIEQKPLLPFPETAFFRRAETRQPFVKATAESDAAFWCESCASTHPIREHKTCREGAA